MDLRRPRDWEREWLVDFASTETFTEGYIWGFSLVAIWPLFLACGVEFFTTDQLTLCAVIGTIGLGGVVVSVQRLRPIIDKARRSYREAHARNRRQRADHPTP